MILAIIAAVTVAIIVLILFKHSSESFKDSNKYIYDTGVPGPCVGVLAGMHGNEPAASYELTRLINQKWFSRVKRGSIRIIPVANQFGLRWNVRNNVLLDMNRQFGENGPLTKDAKDILNFFKPCEIVIDFHEGWGFHQISPESLGSTTMPNSPAVKQISIQLVDDLNNHPLMQSILSINNKKAWISLEPERSCEIPTTLSCYYAGLGKNHILVETTGQNNIQPLEIRQTQVSILLTSLLRQKGMID